MTRTPVAHGLNRAEESSGRTPARPVDPETMDIRATAIPEVRILTPRRFGDARGFFSETWNAAAMAAAGLDLTFVQDNESLSARAGTLRGLHYQAPPHAQAKLVRCGRGRLLDVAVDARAGSPTFGRWVAVELSAENGRQLLVPERMLAPCFSAARSLREVGESSRGSWYLVEGIPDAGCVSGGDATRAIQYRP